MIFSNSFGDQDPHQFEKSFLDPHKNDKPNPDPLKNDKPDPDPHKMKSRIQILIK